MLAYTDILEISTPIFFYTESVNTFSVHFFFLGWEEGLEFPLFLNIIQFGHFLASLFWVCFSNIDTTLFEFVLLSIALRILVDEIQWVQCYLQFSSGDFS